jgi:hypothetical protein
VLLPLRRSQRDHVVGEGPVDLLEGAHVAVPVELPDQLAAVAVRQLLGHYPVGQAEDP